ncbi:MAG: signal peptide peptidase SppA [Myxococcota bacterium]
MSNPTPPRSRAFSFVFKAFAVLGLVTFVGGFGLLCILSLTCLSGEDVPSKTVLELRLDRPLGEIPSSDPVSSILGESGTTVHDVVRALDQAAQDDRVAGVVAYVGGSSGGMAVTQELRDAVLRFRESGKFAYAFSESFGAMSSGTQGYYLASAFDQVWLQPSGELGLVGLMSSSMFYKGTFEMLDVEVLGDRRREYKNAFNSYTERRYTAAHQEAVRTLLEDLLEQIEAGIAEGRGGSADAVHGWIADGPYVAPKAEAAGLVDRLGYRDEVLAAAREKAGDDAQLLYAEKYLERIDPPSGDRTIAVVYGVGAVMQGASGSDPLSGSQTMGSDTVASAIAAAVADDSVDAIVFRVDSPGGSPVASDTIWRETIRAKEAGKPVIVSMGNVAASGGYYVAAGATKIVAQPGTITGSIGVFAGKPNLRKLWNKVGVTWDSVSTSDNARAYSQVHGYDEKGWAALQASLDQIYVDFKSRVAEGRGMTPEQVEEIAKGRVWSGVRAKEIGLVDELGGMADAIRIAKVEAGLEADAEVSVTVFPPSRGWVERLLGGGSGDNSEAVRAHRVDVERWRGVVRTLQEAGIEPASRGAVQMPAMNLD